MASLICLAFNGFNVCFGQRDFLFLYENVMSSSIFRSTIYTALTTALKNHWPGLSCGHEAHN